MLIDGMAVAGVVVVVAAVLLVTRRIARDDVHSVEGYHRSLQTLETINAHSSDLPDEPDPSAERPERASRTTAARLGGSRTVRVTDAREAPMAIPPPPVPDPSVLLHFDDAAETPAHFPDYASGPRDKAMTTMNRRPRRLAAPALAVAAVLVLIVVLVVVGAHKTPLHHHSPSLATGAASNGSPAHSKSRPKHTATATTTTTTPAVSAPQSTSAHSATYAVAGGTFTLGVAATTGSCWVDVTDTSTGAPLFTGTLTAGEQRTVSAGGPITINIGAPTVFSATVNGAEIALPAGFQTPFTMSLTSAA